MCLHHSNQKQLRRKHVKIGQISKSLNFDERGTYVKQPNYALSIPEFHGFDFKNVARNNFFQNDQIHIFSGAVPWPSTHHVEKLINSEHYVCVPNLRTIHPAPLGYRNLYGGW